jgi:UDP-glucuronate 4-epimerase
MTETILVTGGAGFIGFHTAQALLAQNKKVIIVDNFNNYYNPKLKKDRIASLSKKNSTVHNLDISNLNSLQDIFKKNKISKVCHLAAQAGVRYSLENPFAYEKSNILGTLNLLELSKNNNIKDFIFASSSSVYGNNKKVPFSESDNVDHPISAYAATKKSTELLAYTYHHLYNLNCTALRFFTVYGPFGRPDMSYYKFTEAILNNKPIPVFNNGNMRRDFTYVTDVVSGVLSALEKSYPYEIFNLGNSKPIELKYFISLIEKECGREATKDFLPMQPGDLKETFADISKSKKLLGYNPSTSIEEGIKLFVDWYKKYKNIN